MHTSAHTLHHQHRVQTAIDMPPSHFPQPPPADQLNQPISTEKIQLGLQRLNNGRSATGPLQLGKITHPSCSDTVNPCPAQATPRPHISSFHAFENISTRLSSSAQYLQSGRPPLCRPSSNVVMHQIPPTTDSLQWAKPLPNYTQASSTTASHNTEEHQLRTPTQSGFRPHLSTNHQSFVLQHIIDKQLHANRFRASALLT